MLRNLASLLKERKEMVFFDPKDKYPHSVMNICCTDTAELKKRGGKKLNRIIKT